MNIESGRKKYMTKVGTNYRVSDSITENKVRVMEILRELRPPDGQNSCEPGRVRTGRNKKNNISYADRKDFLGDDAVEPAASTQFTRGVGVYRGGKRERAQKKAKPQ
jgi:hypothetical protein